jgi:hypothetical protein
VQEHPTPNRSISSKEGDLELFGELDGLLELLAAHQMIAVMSRMSPARLGRETVREAVRLANARTSLMKVRGKRRLDGLPRFGSLPTRTRPPDLFHVVQGHMTSYDFEAACAPRTAAWANADVAGIME